MNNKSWCSLGAFLRPTSWRWSGIKQAAALISGVLAFYLFVGPTPACANDAPAWMHALVNVPLPAHDEKTDAVLLYSEHIFTVQGNGKIKEMKRAAYKILRVGGRES